MAIELLPPDDDEVPFPDVEMAELEPNGLLAAGGSLRPRRLLQAYRHGIFPWFGPDEPVLWWSPDPRCVVFPEHLHRSRSLQRTERRGFLTVTRNHDFEGVVRGCAAPRADSPGTWIVPAMIDAYCALHERGYAQSFECWSVDGLVGGIYGVQLGNVLFGESMFSRVPDASKMALASAASAKDIALVDCQISSPHLERMGAENIARTAFVRLLGQLGADPI